VRTLSRVGRRLQQKSRSAPQSRAHRPTGPRRVRAPWTTRHRRQATVCDVEHQDYKRDDQRHSSQRFLTQLANETPACGRARSPRGRVAPTKALAPGLNSDRAFDSALRMVLKVWWCVEESMHTVSTILSHRSKITWKLGGNPSLRVSQNTSGPTLLRHG
jgi:hypothetical protein